MPDNEQRMALIRRAWLRWFALYVPSMALIGIATVWFDFNVILGVLIAILVAALLYQRHINKRSWSSIMWGVHAKGE